MADLNWPPHTSYRRLSCSQLQQIQSNLGMIYLHGVFISDNQLDFQVLHRRGKQHTRWFSAWNYSSNYFTAKENPSHFAVACCLAGTQLLFKASASAGCGRTHLYSHQSGVEARGPQAHDQSRLESQSVSPKKNS